MSKVKDRIFPWVDFSILVRCDEVCPLWSECMYGYRIGTKRTAQNCKLWHKYETVKSPPKEGE